MRTTTDVVLCAIVAAYLFLGLAVDERLLLLPSLVACVAALGLATSGRRAARRRSA
ncbi:MAG TPA: hypothetical protein VMH24_04595 [Candidatus Sulfotelmatobacter sp.]|nr:hypothetical protein [Candidatus Sulfotelmatobacter sp.]